MSKSKSRNRPRLAISPGEPAGIGPDICVLAHLAASRHDADDDLEERLEGRLEERLEEKHLSDCRTDFQKDADVVYFGDPQMFQERASLLGVSLDINILNNSPYQPGRFNVHQINLISPVTLGKPDASNASYVLGCLDEALDACLQGECAALVTGPIHKAVICDAGITFSGHTEWLAERTHTTQVVMMLVAGSLRVALATTHLPLRQVPGQISPGLLTRVISITLDELQHRFGIPKPRLLICGLNPHAGEEGYLGSEEIDVMIPVIKKLQGEGHRLTGPVPADTAFIASNLQDVDAVLAMYHDQGLPAFKSLGFGEAVNVTLGLPLVRTSVDHGTALHLAGTGKANPGSLIAALNCALELVSKE